MTERARCVNCMEPADPDNCVFHWPFCPWKKKPAETERPKGITVGMLRAALRDAPGDAAISGLAGSARLEGGKRELAGMCRAAAEGDPVVAEVLGNAAELIRRGWCRASEARDAEGNMTGAVSEDAASWSAAGAVERAAWDLHHYLDVKRRAVRALVKAVGCGDDFVLDEWNDFEDVTREDVLDALARAARLPASEW